MVATADVTEEENFLRQHFAKTLKRHLKSKGMEKDTLNGVVKTMENKIWEKCRAKGHKN